MGAEENGDNGNGNGSPAQPQNGNQRHGKRTAGMMPLWKKGQSGNPSGMAKGTKHAIPRTFTEIAREFLSEPIKEGDPRSRLDVLVQSLFAQAMRGNVRATSVILDRLDPMLRNQLTINNNLMPAEQVRDMLDRIRLAGPLKSRSNGNGNGNGHALVDPTFSD